MGSSRGTPATGDLEAALSILGEDCVLYEPFQPPVGGLENVAPKFEQGLAMVDIHGVSFDSQEVYQQGSALVDFGTYSETTAFDDTASNAVHYADNTSEGFLWIEVDGDTVTGHFYDKSGTLNFERVVSK